ncbi:homoprotocatechuate degradation operon regulator HpaR [Actimicrobium sp. CCC2.4]|uniref:homoprotocatechuate degradation operon regulator HpaR n=1 Tax=Actimicrobium sp. CCC2.4 TaxID=3048606 RepID=UPI002AC8FCA3|nr:homoprotocatechuate degradation operon regulator HpaR [Actimicrobium sp. CCC2.4]MEB0133860.1 homoprotocatechuate degradation operon regulator HpaR [Actimicrobium sp. CCC2.4]WPX31401.1 homoprotocatechuate degradation operon regulator HpaR [Actimicrobium sp. CCC2.4]
MKKRIAHRNLPQVFLKARDCLMAHFRPILNHFGLTEQQWRILRSLDEHGPLEPREICTLCQIQSPSMTGVLARMETMQLVRRSRVEGDQRRVLVQLAKKGDQLMAELAPLVEAQYREIERALGSQLFADLSMALEAFIAADSQPVERIVLPARARVVARRRAVKEVAG